MQKLLFSTLYILSLMTAGLTIQKAFAGRSPSVEPITEVSIEENSSPQLVPKAESGYNFADSKAKAQRVPANIATKKAGSPSSYIGPIIFLIALPVALWIVISKKMKTAHTDKKVDYYPNTFQFKPFKTEYQEQDVDDDQDFPKAS
jgi:hypothetical protein